MPPASQVCVFRAATSGIADSRPTVAGRACTRACSMIWIRLLWCRRSRSAVPSKCKSVDQALQINHLASPSLFRNRGWKYFAADESSVLMQGLISPQSGDAPHELCSSSKHCIAWTIVMALVAFKSFKVYTGADGRDVIIAADSSDRKPAAS
jgi:hypothetical protein